MKNELRAKILEMTLAAFGASACASTQAGDPAKVPSAAEVKAQNPASHAEASCSAAGCGAKADDTAPSGGKSTEPAPPVATAKDVAGASSIATPAATEATPAADGGSKKPEVASDAPAKPAPAKAKPAASKPKVAKKKSADDDGCGAGSCASAK